MTGTEQAIIALRAALRFADHIAESSGNEDAIRLHRQCAEAIGALREERERPTSREQQIEIAVS